MVDLLLLQVGYEKYEALPYMLRDVKKTGLKATRLNRGLIFVLGVLCADVHFIY